MPNEAILYSEKDYTVFKYGKHTIRFLAPYSLERYTEVKEWDHGYLVVMAKYSHNAEPEEEYIDLIPILQNLYFDVEEFLKPIEKVKIQYDDIVMDNEGTNRIGIAGGQKLYGDNYDFDEMNPEIAKMFGEQTVYEGVMKDRDKILFHGSYLEIREPEDNKTETASTDFGEGFYLTELQSQAEKWARRKFNQRKRFDKTAHSVVNVYSLQYDKTINRFQEKYKFFSKTSDEWLDFIVECRSKGQDRYDFVEGPMSDDKLYNFVQNYIDGTISRNEFWELARYKYPTHQIMMRKDALKCLKFIEAYEVEIEE